MVKLIEEVLNALCPESKEVVIVFAHECECVPLRSGNHIERIIAKRLKGDLRPIVVYGFDKPDGLQQLINGTVLDASGLRYLRLPNTISQVKKVFREVARAKITINNSIDEKEIIKYAAPKILAFKHTCDNVWMSMSANANRAKKGLEKFSENMPAGLSEFKLDRIERLLEDYRKLEPIASRLRIQGADKITKMMDETIKMIGKINKKNVSPRESVDVAFRCVETMQGISDILSKVKELNKSE